MPLPIVSVAQMRDWENATWASGQTEAEVIQRVGRKVADVARRLTRTDDFILLLAGKGRNGEDVRAVRHLLAARRVELIHVDSPAEEFPRLEDALTRKPVLIVDGLFGIGLNRPLDAAWIKFVSRINEARTTVLSVDVPSGLNADTGEPWGAAIEATVTLTVGAPKQGLVKHTAWPYVGRLEVTGDVGLIPCPVTDSELRWIVPEDFTGFPPARAASGHKGTFGHVAIVAGSLGFHGAAVLAARGAQRAQPGLISLFTHEHSYLAIASQLQAVMVKLWEAGQKLPENFSSYLIGPGLSAPGLPEDWKLFTRRLWRDSLLPVVLDAGALEWISQENLAKTGIRVITPHPGEAARLRRSTPQAIQANRPQAVRELSRQHGHCWVVLKGHQTLIGRSTGEIYVNGSGNPLLGQGGSGDVLAGFIAGLFAQPHSQLDAAKTLCYAVWQHGATADALSAGRKNWIIEDLATEIGNAT